MSGLRRKPKNDLTGKRFGKLKVISFIEFRQLPYRYGRIPYFLCQCDCGKTKECNGYQLKNGNTTSCGCSFIGSNHHRWKGIGDLSGHLMCKFKANAKIRGWKFKVSKEYLWELFLKQNKKCALTGMDLTFSKKVNDYDGNASLDRIDSSLGYIEGNLQWVDKRINNMKQAYSEKEFIELCRRVVSYKSS